MALRQTKPQWSSEQDYLAGELLRETKSEYIPRSQAMRWSGRVPRQRR